MSRDLDPKILEKKTQSLASKLRAGGYNLPKGRIDPKFYKLLTGALQGNIPPQTLEILLSTDRAKVGSVKEVFPTVRNTVYNCRGVIGRLVYDYPIGLYFSHEGGPTYSVMGAGTLRKSSNFKVGFSSEGFRHLWDIRDKTYVCVIIDEEYHLPYDLRTWPPTLLSQYFSSQVYNLGNHIHTNDPTKSVSKLSAFGAGPARVIESLRRANLRPSKKQLLQINRKRAKNRKNSSPKDNSAPKMKPMYITYKNA